MTVGRVTRDAATAEFFDGTAAGQFLLRHCLACDALSAPQARQCEQCAAISLDWKPASGSATLVSWTVAHGKPGSEDPAVLAIAEFAEGPWWWSRLLNANPGQLSIGAPLRVEFCRNDDRSEAVPVFVLIDDI
jgi:uncharacterized protein